MNTDIREEFHSETSRQLAKSVDTELVHVIELGADGYVLIRSQFLILCAYESGDTGHRLFSSPPHSCLDALWPPQDAPKSKSGYRLSSSHGPPLLRSYKTLASALIVVFRPHARSER